MSPAGWTADERALLSRIEDAGLNASAPPQQRWIDGWIVRFSPGKAKRARCINAVAEGRVPLEQRLQLARAVFDEASLPALFRITPFTVPADLDAQLERRGHTRIDDTRVMVCRDLERLRALAAAPAGTSRVDLPGIGRCTVHASSSAPFARAAGSLRQSSLAQVQAHAHRLEHAPVPFCAYQLRRDDDDALVAVGQVASEGDVVGLYDIVTAPTLRGHGAATALCHHMLAMKGSQPGVLAAYLQVDADNHAARRVYTRLGFVDGYRYHYRVPAGTPNAS
jgi:ribosomal protein S18 acetylase RimI-like enzyme